MSLPELLGCAGVVLLAVIAVLLAAIAYGVVMRLRMRE